MHTQTIRGACAALALAAAATAQVAPERVAVTNARIIPVVGPQIEQGAVLIERGRIVAVGADIEIPYDARVFDATGKVVMPGAVVAHSADGIGWPDEPRPLTPQLDVFDSLDPSDLTFEEALRLGVTAIHVMPGDNTTIGGVGRVVRPIGMTPAEMLIAGPGFVKLSVSPKQGVGSFQAADRLVQRANLREAFMRLHESLEDLSEKKYEEQLARDERKIEVGPAEARKRGVPEIEPDDIPVEQRNLVRLIGGRVEIDGERSDVLFDPLGGWVWCADAMDVAPAIELARAHGFFDRLVLYVGPGACRAVDQLVAAARPVVLSELVYRRTDPLTGKVSETFVPKVFADAGLKFAILPGPNGSLPERFPAYQAAVCIRNGVSPDTALRAITLHAAEALDIDARLGSLEPGKDGSLVIYSGDPLDFNSVVERVIIEGVPVYQRERDPRLQRLLRPAATPETADAPADDPDADASDGPADAGPEAGE